MNMLARSLLSGFAAAAVLAACSGITPGLPGSGNPGASASPTSTAATGGSPTATPTSVPAPSSSPRATPTPTPKATPTPTPRATPTATAAPTSAPTSTAGPVGCTPKINGSPVTYSATVTFYGFPDNSPPSNQIAFPADGGNPTIHNVASGSGTYCDPTTAATELSDLTKLPVGVRIYEAFIKRYFIIEDSCAGCSGIWTDLWVGGSARDNANAVINCEDSLTGGKQSIIVNPAANLPTAPPGPIFTAAPGGEYSCNGHISTNGSA
jgi:hypothetical protein